MREGKRVAVTGLGVLAPNGIGWQQFWSRCRSGTSGVSRITEPEFEGCPVTIGGRILDFAAADVVPVKLHDRTDRAAHLALGAAKMAIGDSGLAEAKGWQDEAAVIVGCACGGPAFLERGIQAVFEEGPEGVHPSSISAVMPSSASGYIAIVHKLGGTNLCVSSGCSSGANAIGLAFRRIQSGDSRVAVTGGVEAPVTPFMLRAEHASGHLSSESDDAGSVARPFDQKRSGSVLAEAAALLVLEELEHAQSRGATIYAEVVGYGSRSSMRDVGNTELDAEDRVRAMAAALDDAGLRAADIQLVIAYGLATRQSDDVEVKALERAFKDQLTKLMISAPKSMTGNSLGASSALEASLCALSLHRQAVTPTINLATPQFPYDFVAQQGRDVELEFAMSNSFGLLSNNSSLIFRRIDGH